MRSNSTRSLFVIAGGLVLSLLAIIYLPTRPVFSQVGSVLSVTGLATDTYPGGETSYRIELLNHTDQIVYDGELSITLPISFTYVPDSTVALGEGWPLESREPTVNGQTLTWGPYHLPAAGNKAHNPYGSHTMMHDCVDMYLHLEGAKALVGNGGYVTQLFYGIDATTTAPNQCAINFVFEAYARNLIPILRLEGHFVNGVWQAPDPGPKGDYAEVAQGFANFVAGLPRRDTNPLYIQIWNEPELWIEWSHQPNAKQYARFFVAVSQAIRQLGDARIRLINAGLAPGQYGFIEQMLKVSGFRDAFDVWASHCYPYNHPASYNNHLGTAQYGDYAIDCYLKELDLIERYGRRDVKVMLTETGYELGSNVFGFEGFSAINETNRANYIASAFADYWRNWPEVVAVTPFELSDTSGHWHKFDWIYPTPPYPIHPQYGAVEAQAKPDGGLEPYGYQIIFKVKTDPDLATGIYPSQLHGSDREGHTAIATDAVPVELYAPGSRYFIYLPLIIGPRRTDGPWYLSTPDTLSPGTIVPDTFLHPATANGDALIATAPPLSIPLASEPQAMAVADEANLIAVLLADGRLQIIAPTNLQSLKTIFIGPNPQIMTTDAPQPSRAYLALENELVLVDLPAGQVVERRSESGRWRGLARDGSTQRLFAVDAKNERLLVFTDDLSQQLATVKLEEQPNQLIFDSLTRQLYLTFPAVPQIIAIDADNLVITAQTDLIGGPILDLALDANRHRLYALSALAPTYRGLTVLETPNLPPLNLVAGSEDFPFRTAATLGSTPTGQLLIPENTDLWQITPDDFAVSNVQPGVDLSLTSEIVVSQGNGTIYLLDSTAKLLRIYQ